MPSSSLLYSRELPGGGYVAIEAHVAEQEKVRARISVERRTEVDRRDGHEPPIVAEIEGDTRDSVFRALYTIASDNVLLAQHIMRWQRRNRGSGDVRTTDDQKSPGDGRADARGDGRGDQADPRGDERG